MKILIIAKTFHPPWATGYAAYVRGLLYSILKLKDVEVSIISTMRPRQYLYNVIERDYFKKYRDEFKKLVLTLKSITYLEECSKNRLRSWIAIMRKTREALEDKGYDVVHDLCGLDVFWLVKSLRGAKILRHQLTPSIKFKDEIHGLSLKIGSDWLKKIFMIFASKCVAKTYGYNIEKRYWYIIPPAIDTETYKPLNIGKRDDGFDSHLLYMGPLTPDRFPLEIIKALKIVQASSKASILLRVLTLPRRKTLEYNHERQILSTASKLGISKHIRIERRNLSLNEKIHLLNQHDVVLYILKGIPKSIVPLDPPITILEAMSCGKPIIASNYMSVSNIIIHGYNGFITYAVNERYIADILLKALINSKRIGINARKTIKERFSIFTVAKNLAKVYERIFYV